MESWWVVLPLLLLRSKSKKTKMVARGPEWVGWSVRLLEALDRGALRVAGTLGVAKAAYVTNLPTDPESALHTMGSSLLCCAGSWFRFE